MRKLHEVCKGVVRRPSPRARVREIQRPCCRTKCFGCPRYRRRTPIQNRPSRHRVPGLQAYRQERILTRIRRRRNSRPEALCLDRHALFLHYLPPYSQRESSPRLTAAELRRANKYSRTLRAFVSPQNSGEPSKVRSPLSPPPHPSSNARQSHLAGHGVVWAGRCSRWAETSSGCACGYQRARVRSHLSRTFYMLTECKSATT